MAKHTQETLRFHPVNGKTVRADFKEGSCPSILACYCFAK